MNQVTSRGCSRAYIVCVLWRAWQYVRNRRHIELPITFPFETHIIEEWIERAKSDCSDVEFQKSMGGTDFHLSDSSTFWTQPSHFFTWWKNNIERKTKFLCLLRDATYLGSDDKAISRSIYCRQTLALAINIKNHFDRMRKQQKDRGIVLQSRLPYRMPVHLESDSLVNEPYCCSDCRSIGEPPQLEGASELTEPWVTLGIHSYLQPSRPDWHCRVCRTLFVDFDSYLLKAPTLHCDKKSRALIADTFLLITMPPSLPADSSVGCLGRRKDTVLRKRTTRPTAASAASAAASAEVVAPHEIIQPDANSTTQHPNKRRKPVESITSRAASGVRISSSSSSAPQLQLAVTAAAAGLEGLEGLESDSDEEGEDIGFSYDITGAFNVSQGGPFDMLAVTVDDYGQPLAVRGELQQKQKQQQQQQQKQLVPVVQPHHPHSSFLDEILLQHAFASASASASASVSASSFSPRWLPSFDEREDMNISPSSVVSENRRSSSSSSSSASSASSSASSSAAAAAAAAAGAAGAAGAGPSSAPAIVIPSTTSHTTASSSFKSPQHMDDWLASCYRDSMYPSPIKQRLHAPAPVSVNFAVSGAASSDKVNATTTAAAPLPYRTINEEIGTGTAGVIADVCTATASKSNLAGSRNGQIESNDAESSFASTGSVRTSTSTSSSSSSGGAGGAGGKSCNNTTPESSAFDWEEVQVPSTTTASTTAGSKLQQGHASISNCNRITSVAYYGQILGQLHQHQLQRRDVDSTADSSSSSSPAPCNPAADANQHNQHNPQQSAADTLPPSPCSDVGAEAEAEAPVPVVHRTMTTGAGTGNGIRTGTDAERTATTAHHVRAAPPPFTSEMQLLLSNLLSEQTQQ